MKRFVKNDAGFTLVELIVAMAMAVIVTAAATSVLLLGLRVNRQTVDTANQQITVQALLDVMEGAAADGKITSIQSDYDSWALVAGEGEEAKPIFSYDSETQTISTNGTVVLEGVYASNAILEGQLLSISVETKEGIFTSAVYCRLGIQTEEPGQEEVPDIDGLSGREKFLAILKSQYRSRGQIIGVDPSDPFQYFSEWYIQKDYDDEIPDNGWNAKTPWCACYVSWALAQTGMQNPPKFADVDKFMAYFQTNGTWLKSKAHGGSVDPQPGDLIFFDWNKGDNPQHVGVVLDVRKNGGITMVYTIEGNSAGRVTVRSYPLTDARIIGYGVIFTT